MIHFPDCVCVRCCAMRIEYQQMALAEERAGREQAWREAAPRFGPRAGTRPAIERRYGAHRKGPRARAA